MKWITCVIEQENNYVIQNTERSIIIFRLIDVNKHQRVPKRQSKMDSPEKLATYGTQDEDDQTKNTIEAVAVAWQLDLQLPVQSGPITNTFVSSNPADGEMYSIQYFELKLVENL